MVDASVTTKRNYPSVPINNVVRYLRPALESEAGACIPFDDGVFEACLRMDTSFLVGVRPHRLPNRHRVLSVIFEHKGLDNEEVSYPLERTAIETGDGRVWFELKDPPDFDVPGMRSHFLLEVDPPTF